MPFATTIGVQMTNGIGYRPPFLLVDCSAAGGAVLLGTVGSSLTDTLGCVVGYT